MKSGSLKTKEAEEAVGLDDYQPRTELGRLLLDLRKKIVASGEPLLDGEGVQKEVAERRGSRTDPDEE